MTLIWQIVKATASQFMANQGMQLGAALAFYTLFSLAPILVIIVAVAGIMMGEQAVQDEVIGQVEQTVSEDAAQLIQTILNGASDLGQGVVAIVISSIITLIGATGVVAQLKASLNSIWKVKPKPGQAILIVIRDRVLSFAMILVVAFLLLVSMVLSAVVSAIVGYMSDSLPVPPWLLTFAQLLVSLSVIALLFAIMFKYLPDIEIRWKDVWVGAAVTSVLFVVGQSLTSAYLAFSSAGSSYGAAGSLVVLLMWVYYSSLIILLGAQFTQVYCERAGEGSRPSDKAVAIDHNNE